MGFRRGYHLLSIDFPNPEDVRALCYVLEGHDCEAIHWRINDPKVDAGAIHKFENTISAELSHKDQVSYERTLLEIDNDIQRFYPNHVQVSEKYLRWWGSRNVEGRLKDSIVHSFAGEILLTIIGTVFITLVPITFTTDPTLNLMLKIIANGLILMGYGILIEYRRYRARRRKRKIFREQIPHAPLGDSS